MALVSIQNLTIGFRGPDLLSDASFQIEPGQRIGLLGRNGTGKSTLLKLLTNEIQPDDGQIIVAPGVKIAKLSQDVPQDIQSSIQEVVEAALPSDEDEELWKRQNSVDQVLSRMELDPTARFETLSSGMKRRVLLAQAIVCKPDLLLLDEPTNHLDLDAIQWLESFLQKFNAAFMFVTHDRMFLRKLATRILEIDRGRIFDWSCDYDTFLKRKEESLAAEEKQNALFDKRLAEEEIWIRKGIKARRTRNEGRVRALKKMRDEHSQRRKKLGTSKLQIQEAQKSGQLVVEAKEISFKYGDHAIVNEFSTTIMRSDKVGIIGPNGAGKTTLLKLLLGQLEPTTGSIRTGTNLEIAYFDQLREQLDEDKTVQDNIGEGSDSVVINGRKKHVLGYLQDFLFAPERARTQVKFLSGGERNRILLARLFSKPANLIVLDEPTNDLDSETLELLEEKLVEFSGTVLMVSHDREFLNNVVTSTIVFEGKANLKEFVGGYDDWQRQVASQKSEKVAPTKQADTSGNAKSNRKPKQEGPRKLKYKEKLELEKLPEMIENLEKEISAIHERMAQPDFYKLPGEEISSIQSDLKTKEDELQTAYQRWEELESIAESS